MVAFIAVYIHAYIGPTCIYTYSQILCDVSLDLLSCKNKVTDEKPYFLEYNCVVRWMPIDISEEHNAYIFRAKK
jgi:hypothetical protein